MLLMDMTYPGKMIPIDPESEKGLGVYKEIIVKWMLICILLRMFVNFSTLTNKYFNLLGNELKGILLF